MNCASRIFQLKVVLFLALIGAATACKVSYSLSGADIPAEAKNFSVKTFQILTPQATTNYDLQLTESLKDLLLAQTRLDLIEKSGDLQYEGFINQFEIGNAAVSGDEITTVNRLTIGIKVKYTNLYDRDKNFERSFSRFADYNSNSNFNDVESQLITQINEQLVQDIFDASIGAW